jgi:glutamate synthase domain-containing protein 2
VTTQDPELSERLDPETGARWVTNYLKALTMELTSLARVPLAGMNSIPGGPY